MDQTTLRETTDQAQINARKHLTEYSRRLTDLSHQPNRAELKALTNKTFQYMMTAALKDAHKMAGTRLERAHAAAAAVARKAATETIHIGVIDMPTRAVTLTPPQWRDRAARILDAAGQAAGNTYRPILSACTSLMTDPTKEDREMRNDMTSHVSGVLSYATNHGGILEHLP